MKTGMTDAGKYGIVATAVRPGHPPRRLLLVLNGVASASLRAAEARRLLNWGFQRFESLVVPKGRHISTLSLWKEGSVNLVTESDLAVTLPKGTLHRAKIVARYYQPLTAPIKKDQKLGELVILIDELTPMVMPLVAEKDVSAPGLWSTLKGWFSGHSPTA
jgi:D-alanyl-D-alanine carboxypeptidase (penicillin-binding protein 5/6)